MKLILTKKSATAAAIGMATDSNVRRIRQDMSFIKTTEQILKSSSAPSEKAFAVCDALIPKIMYIPLPQTTVIGLRIAKLRKQLSENPDAYYLLQVLSAFFEYRNANYQEAIELIEDTRRKMGGAVGDVQIGSGNVVVGASYRSLGKKEEALKYFEYAFEAYGAVPNAPHQLYLYQLSLYHSAELNGEMNNYNKMLKKHLELLHLAEARQNVDFINRSLNGIGRAYLAKGDSNHGIKYLKEAEERSKEGANMPFIARNLHDLGIAYAKMKDYPLALANYKKALDIRTQNGYINARITTLLKMSEIYIAQRNFNDAIANLQDALSSAEPLNVKRKIYAIYQRLANACEHAGNYRLALEYHKKYHQLKEEVDDVNTTQIENQKVRAINAELRQQKNIIEQQKIKIEQTVEQLQEANRYLENFASVAAHDLKAPMRVIANFSNLIKRKYGNVIDDDAKEYLQFITDNMKRLSGMIDDLLSLSKIGRSLPKPKVVDTHDVILQVLKQLNEYIIETNTHIKVLEQLPLVQGHATLISQVFQNILENAIKHSAEKVEPRITISAEVLEDQPEFVQFAIKDNGSGIPEYLQPYIFELFSGASRSDSSGIGLATCKRIVTHYNGQIWVSSEEGIGTTVFFTLPLYRKNA